MIEYPRMAVVWKPEDTPAALRSPLRVLGEEYPIREGHGDGIAVRFEPSTEPGLCRVVRTGSEALITYDIPAMALRAVAALLAGLVGDGDRIEERSAFKTFGIMLDASRNAVMRVDHFKRWLSRLALLGYNMAMLYTEDTYELPGEKHFGYLRGAYTPDELRLIDDCASRLGIEMIPCIQTLGHLEQILQWPAYEPIRDTAGVLLVDEERSYALIDKMLSRCAEVFTSRRIHIGMDETHDLGRGRFLDRFGYERPFDVFNRHLRKVVDLCAAHGLKPMIWSDMYFRLGSETGDYYDPNCSIPQDVIDAIPPSVELVYWDYYHDNKGFYHDWIARHRALGFEPVVGSGVWTWSKVWHDHYLTEAHAGPCIDACREAGVKEIFFTLWGDDGAYCDFDSAFAGLAFAAEKAFSSDFSEDALAGRFRAVCVADYRVQLQAGSMNRILAPACVLWDDPLFGIFLRREHGRSADALARAEEGFAALAASLEAHVDDRRAGDINHARLLAKALAAKIGVARRLFSAYAERDRAGLAQVRARVPELSEALRELLDSFRSVWLARNKPFGLEVIQIRFGGLLMRCEELGKRLDDFVAGRIDVIPELEAEPIEKPGYTCYRRLATPSFIL
ncbi:MAG: family 20 glycosylhydrolase [Planctomycetota bacterium]